MLDCQQAKGVNKEGDIPPAAPNSPEESCEHCEGSGESAVYWGIQLDDDLLETIINIYPEWFKNCSTTSTGLRCNGMADRHHGHQKMTPLLTAAKAMGTSSSENSTQLKNKTAKLSEFLFLSNQSSADSSSSQLLPPSSSSPPKCQVDEASLQKTMDKNKESLKVKLMLRRPITQLVEQGILPPLKTPPAFHEQRQKLERAKMGDILKNKIQRRPDRQELIQHNILEDTTVDPSLQVKQRQLKKARLADDLNDRLSHRPGPLELVKGNILQADELFAQAIKEGQILFKPTCEGQLQKHPPPRFIIEEDSGSDVALSPPQDLNDLSQGSLPSVFESGNEAALCSIQPLQQHGSPPPVSLFLPTIGISTMAPVAPVISMTQATSNSILMPSAIISSAPQTSIFGTASSLLGTSSITTVSVQSSAPTPSTMAVGGITFPSQSTSSSAISKPRKKSKSKAQPKARTIKFHEYKGPPNAQKNQSSNPQNSETSYELLLQQQQLFLQWQLEWQQKYPQIILPATQKQSPNMTTMSEQSILSLTTGSGNSNGSIGPPPPTMIVPSPQTSILHQSQSNEVTSPTIKIQTKLEDMKVSDLKVELKKRNLPVSGSKPQLIERLRCFGDLNPTVVSSSSDSSHLSTASILNSPPHSMPINVSSIMLDAQATLTTVHPTVTLVDGTSQSAAAAMAVAVGSNSPSNADIMADLLVPKHSPVSPPSLEGSHSNTAGFAQDSRPPSVVPMDIDNSDNAVDSMDISVVTMQAENAATLTNEEIVRFQQRKIEELQRQLQRSQMQLQQQQLHLVPSPSPTPPPAPLPSTSVPMQIVQQPVVTSIALIPSPPSQVQPIHRQLLQQHLQQKMQQNAGNTSGKAAVSTKAATTNVPTGTMSSAAVKASLAAFLHSQHGPLSIKQEGGGKAPARSPNGLNQQRTSSLPSLLPESKSRQSPPRTTNSQAGNNNNRPPPPDYDEATKQLNKQQFAAGVMNHLSGQRISGKKSIKSQAVDDVLEILIKNGELPPSAAQEPPTPTTPESAGKSGNSTTQPPVFPDPQKSTSAESSPSPSNKEPKNNLIDEAVVLHAPSPPSLLSGQGTVGNETLDFDFHLDLDDMEAMDLGSVLGTQPNKDIHSIASTNSDLTHSEPSLDSVHSQTVPPSISDLVGGFQDVGVAMDVELSDWLDVMIPTSSSSSTSNHLAPLNCHSFGNFSSGSSGSNNNNNLIHGYTSNHEHDPLLSNLGQQSHDPFDLFAVDMDFKTPTDLSALSWDKVDFATT